MRAPHAAVTYPVWAPSLGAARPSVISCGDRARNPGHQAISVFLPARPSTPNIQCLLHNYRLEPSCDSQCSAPLNCTRANHDSPPVFVVPGTKPDIRAGMTMTSLQSLQQRCSTLGSTGWGLWPQPVNSTPQRLQIFVSAVRFCPCPPRNHNKIKDFYITCVRTF